MRHRNAHRKLGRVSEHRIALLRNQATALLMHERIETTLPKAKELRPIAEKVITRGKHGTLHDRRWVLRWVISRDLVKKVFDVIAPRFTERPGGYLRIVKLGPRQGDGAEMAVLELVEREEAAAPEPAEEKKARGGSPKPPKTPKPKPKKEQPKAEAKPKREPKETKKVSTKKEGRAQVSTPKKSV